MKMKSWFAGLALLVLALPGRADEIKFTSATKWDDVSHALSIRPFYLEVKSDTVARKLTLVMDVYQGGKLIKQYGSVIQTSLKAGPIDLKSALFFTPKDNAAEYQVTWTFDRGEGLGTSHLIVPKSVIDLSPLATKAIPSTIATSARSLVALIVCGYKDQVALGDDMAATLEANKAATIIGIYLERE